MKKHRKGGTSEKNYDLRKKVQDEQHSGLILKYFLLIHSGECGKVYGVEVEKMDDRGFCESNMIYGISEKRKDVEKFIDRLWKGNALPVELATLYDDFVSERELGEEQSAVLTVC